MHRQVREGVNSGDPPLLRGTKAGSVWIILMQKSRRTATGIRDEVWNCQRPRPGRVVKMPPALRAGDLGEARVPAQLVF